MNREIMLLKMLKKEEDVVSAGVLATSLNVSTRTIRNYIKKINSLLDKECIYSTNKGYRLNHDMYNKVMFELNVNSNKTRSERVKYIVGSLLKNKEGIETWVLSEELDISENTLASDLCKIQEYFNENSLYIKRDKYSISIEGKERDKRRLIRKIFCEEAHDQISYFFSNQDIFTDLQVEELKSSILEKLSINDIEINEFALSNVLLHLIVAIKRLKENQTIESTQYKKDNENCIEYKISKEIFDEISSTNNIKVNDEEIESLKMLLVGNTVNKKYSNIVTKEVGELTSYIINQINKVYLIDLDNESFYIRFSIHIENLIRRRSKNISNPNPMLKTIQKNHPLIYDMGLFIGNLIEERIGYDVPEEEIAYISLHIGSFVNEKFDNELVSISILCPKYNDIDQKIVQNLNYHFNDKIIIKEVITSYSQVNKLINSELVITTIPYEGTNNQEVVFLAPFFNMADIKRIEHVISKINLHKKISYYQALARKYFKEEFFYNNIYKETKEEYINFLGEKLIQSNIIDQEYLQSVHQRENMSSTSFEQVAMPHSLYRTSSENVFSVLYNSSSIAWDIHTVDIIILMSLNNNDNDVLNDFIQLLIGIISEKNNIKKIISKRDYSYFIEVISEMIKQYLERE